MTKMARVRFGVPETELLHLRALLGEQGFSSRLWAEVMLTYLCCPGSDHPAVSQKGVDTPTLLRMAHLRAPALQDATAHYDYRWPASLIPLMDPGLAAADLSLSNLLSILWSWTHTTNTLVNVNLAARLAAFATSFTPTSRTWQSIRADYKDVMPSANPHALVSLPKFRCELLPWVVRVKGV